MNTSLASSAQEISQSPQSARCLPVASESSRDSSAFRKEVENGL